MRVLDDRTHHAMARRDITLLPMAMIEAPRGATPTASTENQGLSIQLRGNCDRECSNAREPGNSEKTDSSDERAVTMTRVRGVGKRQS